jgi:dienelactone hydrolase
VLLVGVVVSAVMEAARHRSGRAAGVAVASLGLVGLAVGVSITLSYLGSTGWSVRALGGLLAVCGGAVSVMLGVLLAVRATRGWRRLLAVPVVVAVGYGIGVPIAVSVYATNVGRPSLGAETPADRGLSYVDASFTTGDGATLSGWYLPSTNRAAVVLLHGASSTRSGVLDQAAVLAHHGYGVLLYDARGMGRSGGRAMNLGWYGDPDIAAAISYLQQRADVDPDRIGAMGESMGGEQAIGAMATDERLRAVVAEGATNRVAGDWTWLSDEYGVRGDLQRGVHWLTTQLTDLLTDARPPVALRDAVATARRPVLLIAAGNVADEVHAARSIQAAAPVTVELWVVPGADHTGGLRAQPTAWEHRVTSFLTTSLEVSR